MANIVKNAAALIGQTPLFEMSRFGDYLGLDARLLAKLECFNLSGSVKDRIALSMLDAAEAEGKLRPGGVIVEATSGNTGIGLAALCAARGYRVILTMPETMSVERQKLLKAYGAELVLTEGALGMKGALNQALALAEEIENAFIPSQFENPANPRAHWKTTGPEIWRDTGGKVDIFLAGAGTGGTISGAGGYLKSKNPHIHVVAIEPMESPVLSQGKAGPHGIQGIGAGFVPDTLDREIYDEVFPVSTEDALWAARLAAQTEGLLLGISSGAALFAAAQVAKRPENPGKTMVLILPDTGERYLSTALFEE